MKLRVPDGLAVAGLVALVCVPVWPGIFNPDAQFMLLETRSNGLSRNYAPLHGLVWRLLDRVGLPPGVVFLLGVTAFVTAVLILVKQYLPPVAARLTAIGIVLFPPVYGLLGLVSRDVWFVTSVLVITTAVWHVAGQTSPPSFGMITLLTVAAIAAADARQNGVPFATLAIVVAALGTVRLIRPQAAAATRVASVAVALAVFFAVLLLAQAAVVTHRIFPEQSLYASDLVGVSLTGNELALDDFLFPAQDLSLLRNRLGSLDLEALVYADPPIVRHRNEDPETNAAWAKQWREMLRERPLDYLAWRTRLYLAQLGVTHGVRRPYHEQSVERDNGLRPEVVNAFPALLRARNRALSAVNGPVETGSLLVVPLLYVVGGFTAIWILGRRSGEWWPAVALLAILAAMQAILFFTAPGSTYRFQYYQVVIAVIFGSIAVAGALSAAMATHLARYHAPEGDSDSLTQSVCEHVELPN